MDEKASFLEAKRRSEELEAGIRTNPERYRVLTGDRPTGRLHVGHYFGSLANRVRLQETGVESFIVIADYQVLTDREVASDIAGAVRGLVTDYLGAGLDPEKNLVIFPHSHVPELNQLVVPFLSLISNAELDRNPTVKEEIAASTMKRINAGMYTYPVHQAADILAVKGNLVPVGKDQLPHLELTRTIAKRFNKQFKLADKDRRGVFPMPQALLSEAPMILGLDGSQKMSKSRGNTIMLRSTADEVAQAIKKAKTDSERIITFDPDNRPEVSNLLLLGALARGCKPEELAAEIGDGGAGVLKRVVTEALNDALTPIRERIMRYEAEEDYIREVLRRGVDRAREVAAATLEEVRDAMGMRF